MHLVLRSLVVLSPFILCALHAEDENKSVGPCKSAFSVMHAGVRHTEARGVGYRDGYTTFEAFGIYDHNPSFMPFLDVRGHVFDSGKGAGNVGIGERTALFSIKHLLGVYFYYDVRQDEHGLTVNQVSPGIELLGSRMEYRLNGYFPVGGTKGHEYDRHFKRFKGNNIIAEYNRREALKGGDGEVGVHITQSTTYDLYAAAGAYYFNASEAKSWGGRTRLLGRYKDYISLEASYSYDRLFKSVVQGTVSFNMPFGPKLKNRDRNCGSGRNLWFSRAAFSPSRFEIPVVKRVRHRYKAINPATGAPWQVVFVDNTSHSAGTYASPFPTLAQAENASAPNDMIYVFPGDGTTNGMDQGIVLQDGQALFGSGISHKIATTKGNLKIRAFSKTTPSITNLSGDVVTLGNGNTVSGMGIQVVAPLARGIVSLADINQAQVTKNAITVASGTNGAGIDLVISGKAKISQNLVTTTASSGIGIFIGKEDATNIDISKNNVSGFQFGIWASGPSLNSSSRTVIQDNTVSRFARLFSGVSQGITCELDPNGFNKVSDNIITNTQGFRAFGISAGLLANSVIKRNTINATNMDFGIALFTLDSTANPITELSKNTLNNVNVGISIQTAGTGSSFICAGLDKNRVTSSGVAPVAFLFQASAAGDFIDINSFEGNVGGPATITGSVFFVEKGTCNP